MDIPVDEVIVEEPPIALPSGRPDGEDGWKLEIIERDGTWVTDLPKSLQNAKIVEQEGEPPTLDFSGPISRSETAEVHLVTREARVWLDDDIVFNGPVLQRKADSDSPHDFFKAWGVEWYFGRLYYGDLPEELGWPVTMRHTGSSFSTYLDMHGFTFKLRVRATINISEDYNGAGGGLTVNIPGYSAGSGDSHGSAAIDSFTPRGVDTSIACTLQVNDANGVTIEASLTFDEGTEGSITIVNGPQAFVVKVDGWDQEDPPVPQLTLSQLIMRSVGGLNIGYWEEGGAGALFPQQADRHLMDFLNDGLGGGYWGYKMVYTGSSRVLSIYRPRAGRDIDPEDLTLSTNGTSGNIKKYYIGEDGTKARSRLTVTGDNGARGVATIPGAWDGMILQDTESAPSGTPDDFLESIAWNKLRANMGMIRSLVIYVSTDLRNQIQLYDRVLVVINHATRQVNDIHRVIGREFEVGSSLMKLTVTIHPPSD